MKLYILNATAASPHHCTGTSVTTTNLFKPNCNYDEKNLVLSIYWFFRVKSKLYLIYKQLLVAPHWKPYRPIAWLQSFARYQKWSNISHTQIQMQNPNSNSKSTLYLQILWWHSHQSIYRCRVDEKINGINFKLHDEERNVMIKFSCIITYLPGVAWLESHFTNNLYAQKIILLALEYF